MAEDQLISTERYPYLRILVEVRGVRFEGLALLDTGYTGELVIPEERPRRRNRHTCRTH